MAEPIAAAADTIRLIRPGATIARAATAVAAFVGRALKGPVNQPVHLQGFEDYQRIFGGLWQPSTLSYAVEQFFENGGRHCIVVRVSNGARPPTLVLRAGAGTLRLAAQCPGTREFLRAAVDYDGISAADPERFNLVVQRIRAPGSEFIDEQEIFRRVSIRPGAERALPDALVQSRLVRLAGPLPAQRPDPTPRAPGATPSGYVLSTLDGDDGDPLTIYDVIGSATDGTGLFALGNELFNFLYLPPLARDAEIGLPALLVALRLCRERQAMLLVDPPAAWVGPEAALAGLRSWPLFSDSALMFYPRLCGKDRLRGREELFGPAAAGAGLIARLDELRSLWAPVDAETALLRPGLRPAASVHEVDRIRLAQQGINVLWATRPGSRGPLALRTLTPETGMRAQWRGLGQRRLALFIMRSIAQGTRWVAFERAGPALWQRLRAQVIAFFEGLAAEGAFAGRSAADNYFVICDGRLNAVLDEALPGGEPLGQAQHALLFGFAPTRAGQFETCLVTHGASGASVRPVSVNRYALQSRS